MKIGKHMGDWKKRQMKKGQRASQTAGGRGRTYLAVPPASGWPGGTPEQNGYKHGSPTK